MSESGPQPIFLKDYQPALFTITKVELWFELGECLTTVKSKLQIIRKGDHQQPLMLDGEDMRLIELYIDGAALMPDQFKLTNDSLTIFEVPDSFQLEVEVEINPGANKSLSGLYTSKGNYCTQCESHGFRKITYFLDRPDVMCQFTTTITADSASFPYLLSNGNCIDRGDLPGGRHWVKWHDPSAKPSYLFALVAGSFEVLTDNFVTRSGRNVQLELFVEHGKIAQAGFAMSCLKKSMKWDEDTFNREYDLDIYMIVAVSDFNFGAMENKGLNIFNDRYILAKGDTATDQDFLGVDVVVAHEYFHNWSGNRVTLRDWFQLSLKEGLTVYREQKYTEDISVANAIRVHQAKIIETAQFKEDSGPMAHPIRPASYIDMNNFYTVTVYNKGAEIVRMLATLLSGQTFNQALDVYFERFDGQAVTTTDFVDVMEEVSAVDLKQFRMWYDQAGTPEVTVESNYDSTTKQLQLTFSQQTLPTHGQAIKVDLHIPLVFRLYGHDGQLVSFKNHEDIVTLTSGQYLYSLRKNKEVVVLHDVAVEPILSCLEGFSAPVKLHQQLSDLERRILVTHGLDGYQQRHQMEFLYLQFVKKLLDCDHKDKFPMVDDLLVNTFEFLLNHGEYDPLMVKEVIEVPAAHYLLEKLPGTDINKLCDAVNYLQAELGQRLSDSLLQRYADLAPNVPYQYNKEEVSKRTLRNYCLMLLNTNDDRKILQLTINQYKAADNMTDMMGAMAAMLHSATPELEQMLADFYQRFQHDNLVVDKWFALQARADAPGSLGRIKKLMQHEAFDIQNPNRVRALIATFSQFNLAHFHREDGLGYEFLAKVVNKVQAFNPQLAARLIAPFLYWNRYAVKQQKLMLTQLRQLHKEKLHKNVVELVVRALADAPQENHEAENL